MLAVMTSTKYVGMDVHKKKAAKKSISEWKRNGKPIQRNNELFFANEVTPSLHRRLATGQFFNQEV